MKSIARDAQEMQTLLGEHQDAVVAATFLGTTSDDEDIEAGSAFTYGQRAESRGGDSCISEELTISSVSAER
jgi:hypothetical protein